MKAMFATESNWDEKDVRGNADSYLAPFMAHDVVMIGEGVRTGYFPLECERLAIR